VEKVALGEVFSEYFGFSCQFSFHRLLHIRHHISSGAGSVGQLVGDVPSGLGLTPPQGTNLVTISFLHSLSKYLFSIQLFIAVSHMTASLNKLHTKRQLFPTSLSYHLILYTLKLKLNSVACSPQANSTDRAAAAC
jgi:hypothetical protein